MAETFTVFRTRMGAPTGWSADDFLSDLGEALLMEGGVQKHEWTAASPTTIQKSWLRGKLSVSTAAAGWLVLKCLLPAPAHALARAASGWLVLNCLLPAPAHAE